MPWRRGLGLKVTYVSARAGMFAPRFGPCALLCQFASSRRSANIEERILEGIAWDVTIATREATLHAAGSIAS